MGSSISVHSRGLFAAALIAFACGFAGTVAPARAEESRPDAIAARDRQVTQHASAESMYAAASVRVSRPEAPTMDDLIRADLLAAAAIRLAPGEPWGYLAQLELARRWGDPTWTAQRLAELEKAAPAHPLTRRAAAGLYPVASWSFALAWGALALLSLFTLAHALRRRASAPRVRARMLPLTALVLVTLLAPGAAHAGEPFPIDDANPEANVPTPAQADGRPMDFAYYLQELSQRAEAAMARGDAAAAVRYDRALARAVPDSSLPLAQLCTALLAAGRADEALVACRAALALSGVRAQDFVRFGDLVLAKPSPSATELADVEAAARHLVEADATRVTGWQLECRLGVRTSRAPLLEECTRGLRASASADPSTFVYAWSLALLQGHLDEARGFINQARAAGLDAAALARMQQATGTRAGAGGGRGLWLAALAVLLFAALALLLRRLRQAHLDAPVRPRGAAL